MAHTVNIITVYSPAYTAIYFFPGNCETEYCEQSTLFFLSDVCYILDVRECLRTFMYFVTRSIAMKRLTAVFSVCVSLLVCGCSTQGSSSSQNSSAGNQETADNGIPVVYLTIDPAEFDKVNESEDHSYRASGASIRITVPEGYDDNLTPDSGELELSYIRGRGHGTWAADKKPYRIALAEKADLLGMGENKHWVLLANRYDETMLRNRVISYMGKELGLEYTPESVPVDLFVNGEYYGSYVLSENVRIGSSRIEIDELTEEDTGEPEITGGYLMSLNPDYDEAEENTFISGRMVRFCLEEPQYSQGEKGVNEQKEYITSYLQKTEDVIYSDNFCDEDGIPISEYMDLQSAADYWWIQEFSGNHDAFITSSTYLYKKRDGKLYWGPLWDFDLSLGGGLDDPAGFLHRNMIWLDHLRAYNPEYQQILKERWQKLDGIIEEVIRTGGMLDTWADEIEASRTADDQRWPMPDENGGTVEINFRESVEQLRSWMSTRREWINRNIDTELTHVYNTVTFTADGETVYQTEVFPDRSIGNLPAAPDKEGYLFAGWVMPDGKKYEYDTVDGDLELQASYIPYEEGMQAEAVCFSAGEYWTKLQAIRFDVPYTLVPSDTADNNLHWRTSDPETAEADEFGVIHLKKTGDVTVSAYLQSGASAECVLHILDRSEMEYVQPETLETDQESYDLKAGEYRQIIVSLLPQPNSASPVFVPDDENVVTVDAFGVMHAENAGETVIRITSDSGEGELNKEVNITVTE